MLSCSLQTVLVVPLHPSRPLSQPSRLLLQEETTIIKELLLYGRFFSGVERLALPNMSTQLNNCSMAANRLDAVVFVTGCNAI